MVEWLNGGTTGRREGVGCRASGPWRRVVPPQQAGGRGTVGGSSRFPPLAAEARLSPGCVRGSMGSQRRGARSLRGREGAAPTKCVVDKCFDPLVRKCVDCRLLRTPEPGPASPPPDPPPPRPSLPPAPCSLSPSAPPAAGPGSLAPGTALQPQESVGAGAAAETEAEAALPLPALLFGAPALLGLALALVLVGLLSWRWRRRRRRLRAAAPPGDPDPHPHEPSDDVIIHPPKPLDATAPVWPPPREDPANTPPAHSVPVPATELGSTELVTTKTAGPEQQ
ncbi:tumor necrosis factor receptor superfamily member 13C isoform X1 [Lynx rufus]|uniref:tumor necrosis factor receptor superfamily member 13C isoform X1 n=1 Tax=Lynx rufus TaxID=61384 RepID=UPI001F122FC9|nr:tumor necrosis factor receptor superfamily member 13C isoform X1 [Lynx rufus]